MSSIEIPGDSLVVLLFTYHSVVALKIQGMHVKQIVFLGLSTDLFGVPTALQIPFLMSNM